MNPDDARVLVVDDEWLIRQQLSRALAAVGLSCDCAIDGEDALHWFVRRRYDLVVTDLRMPEHHGHSLATTLLRQPSRPKIVALTGVRDPRLKKDLLARGVDDVVYKPVNYRDFASRMVKILAKAESFQSGCVGAHAGDLTKESDGSSVASRSPRDVREQIETELENVPCRNPWINTTLRSIDWHRIPFPPPEIYDCIDSSAKTDRDGSDFLSTRRVAMSEVAVAIALDEALNPVGDPYKVVVRDLSRQSIGLLQTERVESPNLAVMWLKSGSDRVVALLRVVGCQRRDSFFEVESRITW